MLAFLDASALIYLTEGKKPFATFARHTLQGLSTRHPSLRVALSRLTWLECRI